MRELCLNFYGVPISAVSDNKNILESLRRDFEYFVVRDHHGKPPVVRLFLHAGPPPHERNPSPIATFRTSEFAVYDRRKTRFVRYHDGALAIYDFACEAGEKGRIFCPDPERLHELAYLAILSRAGEHLDCRGLHRIHALGFEFAGKGGLLLLPSGGGKSLMALEMARSRRMGIVSDDTPLISAQRSSQSGAVAGPDKAEQARLLTFPLRWSFQPSVDLSGVPDCLIRPFRRRRYGPKRLVDMDFFKGSIRTDLPICWLFVGKNAHHKSKIEPIPRPAAVGALATHLVIGCGIAQMAEYILRPAPADIWKLMRIAASRAQTARRMLKGVAGAYRFVMSTDIKDNLRTLSAFLEASSVRAR